MSIVGEILKLFLSFLKTHFLKFFLIIFFAVVFIFVLFPFEDLGDLVSTKISELSNNQSNLNFNKMDIKFFPTPGVEFSQVFAELAGMPTLSAKELIITPSISGLINQKPSGRIVARGIFKGNIDVSVSSKRSREKDVDSYDVELSAENLNLYDIKQTTNFPVGMKGQLTFSSKALADLKMSERPPSLRSLEINDFSLSVKQLEVLPSTVELGPFPLSIPGFKVSLLDLKGKLNDGRFTIDSGRIGQPNDEISGTITGLMNLSFQNTGVGMAPQFGAYELLLNLKIKKNFQEKAALFLLFIDNYKRALPDGYLYKVKLSGTQFGPPPRVSPLQ